jgi:hypothetical protein
VLIFHWLKNANAKPPAFGGAQASQTWNEGKLDVDGRRSRSRGGYQDLKIVEVQIRREQRALHIPVPSSLFPIWAVDLKPWWMMEPGETLYLV